MKQSFYDAVSEYIYELPNYALDALTETDFPKKYRDDGNDLDDAREKQDPGVYLDPRGSFQVNEHRPVKEKRCKQHERHRRHDV